MPPWIWWEKAKKADWIKDSEKNPDRQLHYCFSFPPFQIEKINAEVLKDRIDQICPDTTLDRYSQWEGFPGPGWSTVMTNMRVVRLRAFDGTMEGVEKARLGYLQNKRH